MASSIIGKREYKRIVDLVEARNQNSEINLWPLRDMPFGWVRKEYISRLLVVVVTIQQILRVVDPGTTYDLLRSFYWRKELESTKDVRVQLAILKRARDSAQAEVDHIENKLGNILALRDSKLVVVRNIPGWGRVAGSPSTGTANFIYCDVLHKMKNPPKYYQFNRKLFALGPSRKVPAEGIPLVDIGMDKFYGFGG